MRDEGGKSRNQAHRLQPVGPARRFIVHCVFSALLPTSLLLQPGCYQPPEFTLNTEGRDPAASDPVRQQAVDETLEDLFGTPDRPLAPLDSGLDLDRLVLAAGRNYSDEGGTNFGLFRRNCSVCHGVSGGGDGTGARLLTPYPRDFRNGVFKYTSTPAGAKPARKDLLRTLHDGLPGTAMPSFAELPEAERESLVEYVKYLAVRGETELFLTGLILDEQEPVPLSADTLDMIADEIAWYAALWAEAETQRIEPPPRPPVDTPEQLAASIAKGRELYRSKNAQCATCHGPDGRGDGGRTDLYDVWNERKLGDSPEATRAMAARFALPIQRLWPRNYSEGIFHGGDRPIDIYRRIAVGIKGTPMPASGPAPGQSGVFTPEEIWHLVDYVRSLGHK